MIYEGNVPRWGGSDVWGKPLLLGVNAPKQAEVPIVETQCYARFAHDPEGGSLNALTNHQVLRCSSWQRCKFAPALGGGVGREPDCRQSGAI